VKRSLAHFEAATGGRLHGGDAAFTGVSTDTRTLRAGELFVALSGPNFDGHAFVAAAAERGAAGAVVARRVDVALPQIVVPDTLRALQDAARAWRDHFEGPVVAVAGSNGKTTTKELVAAILSGRGPCHATRGNLNNHIGVPLTLLALEPTHASAVIEIGANRLGDVAELMPLVCPTVALVTNAGAEHLEGFGDLDGVARGEGETFAGLEPGATAVINQDDPYADLWRGMNRAERVLTFGLGGGADFRAEAAHSRVVDGEFVQQFRLVTPAGVADARLALAGRHNLVNALAAAAAASAAGAAFDTVVEGLARMRAVKGRLQLKRAHGGGWLVDDSYNANPSSLRAGIDVLRDLPGDRWLVLGEMAELGAHTRDAHVEAGRYAREAGLGRLYAIGAPTREAVTAFGPGAEWFESADALAARVRGELRADVTVLIKGSRLNRLERVVEALAATGAGAGAAPGPDGGSQAA
jgi:UDP-N-acetylmuramoyl-tripeptide--D-alanyl-D-alanine ligase